MSYQDLFSSLAEDGAKAKKIDEQHPDCSCESVSVSPYSAGPVRNQEMVWRLILSPVHHDTETGKIKALAFRDVWDKGMSVLREDIVGSRDAIMQRGEDRASANPDRKFEYAIGAQVDNVRKLRSLEGEGRFCVYDTAEPNDPSHADICQTRHPGKKAQSILRRELQKIFVHVIPDSIHGVL